MEKTDPGTKEGSAVNAPVASSPVEKPAAIAPARNDVPPPLPTVPIGTPGYIFKFPADSPEGQDERREHERKRKAAKRADRKLSEPPPLPAAPVVDSPQAPAGQSIAGDGTEVPPAGVEVFVPWLAADVADFTDELVELTEAKRIADFVAIAREAELPGKLVAEIERTSGYPTKSKAALKRCLADCAAKWLNKTGVSSRSKEEVKLLFCVVTVKMQGIRLKRDLLAMIADDRARRIAAEQKPKADNARLPA